MDKATTFLYKGSEEWPLRVFWLNDTEIWKDDYHFHLINCDSIPQFGQEPVSQTSITL
jgi:hypothetical protein